MNSEDMRCDSHCQICQSDDIVTVLKLADTPPEDQFVSKDRFDVAQPCFPLEQALCQNCGYVFLPHILSPKISYQTYTYETSVTLGLTNQYQSYADDVLENHAPAEDLLVVDLGSNDGTMLRAFKRDGVKVLGVEPASQIAQKANGSGIPTINDFFSRSTCKQIIEDHGKASVVTANYMFANIDGLLAFTENVANLLCDDGVFVVLTGYHPEQMKINMFDYIYHEHFSYFTVAVLNTLFEKSGLELIDAIALQAKGGSIRVTAQKKGQKRQASSRLLDILKEEYNQKMHDAETYFMYSKNINKLREECRKLCKELKDSGARIIGYGASHSTTTLVYHFGLAEFLEYQIDDNPVKQGMYSPGHHIPVFSTDKLYQDKPEVVIVLAWNYAKPIIDKHTQFIQRGGRFILPLPALELVGL
ncbi:class I SAM-dependent methyltransferase [Paraglaciecola sp. MB-3u-78]|uniref:class I SAM-dependent methyltransferase n=1 Tax=Paraglaciecola sp. MB-3u-78 TaxID=2058332 RepID=UPI000C347715|nr:class I SAM-dependent methyltransferase [Paraglaciecola sp. MB-3u-78]PKH00819.1 methyltransferase [Paraglaciecola sp. MB-3u-78]